MATIVYNLNNPIYNLPDTVYVNHVDEHVGTHIVYYDATVAVDTEILPVSYMYKDRDYTQPLSNEEAIEWFAVGMVVSDGASSLGIALSCDVTNVEDPNSPVAVTFFGGMNTNGPFTLFSKEYTTPEG